MVARGEDLLWAQKGWLANSGGEPEDGVDPEPSIALEVAECLIGSPAPRLELKAFALLDPNDLDGGPMAVQEGLRIVTGKAAIEPDRQERRMAGKIGRQVSSAPCPCRSVGTTRTPSGVPSASTIGTRLRPFCRLLGRISRSVRTVVAANPNVSHVDKLAFGQALD